MNWKPKKKIVFHTTKYKTYPYMNIMLQKKITEANNDKFMKNNGSHSHSHNYNKKTRKNPFSIVI